MGDGNWNLLVHGAHDALTTNGEPRARSAVSSSCTRVLGLIARGAILFRLSAGLASYRTVVPATGA